MTIKDKDFIEIDYTGKTKEEDLIFDTTNEKTAKDNNIYNEQMKYQPLVICVGQGQLIKGLDQQIIGKEVDKEYTFDIKAEQAFGKKSAKLLKIVPTRVFKKQNIQPMPGLQVNIDGVVGVIRTVTGGRVIVDFNHPLSSKDLVYIVKINKLITDNVKKIESFILLEFGFKPEKIEIKDSTAKVIIKKINFNIIKDSKDKISDKLTGLIDDISKIVFVEEQEKKEVKTEVKEESKKEEEKVNKETEQSKKEEEKVNKETEQSKKEEEKVNKETEQSKKPEEKEEAKTKENKAQEDKTAKSETTDT